MIYNLKQHPFDQENTVHASMPTVCSKVNTDGDNGTSHNETTTLPPVPDVSFSQPTNLNPLIIPPPSDFSSDIPLVVQPPLPPPPVFDGSHGNLSGVQPNYIFINNINEFSGLPAAIRTANYVRPDRTSENFSEMFFDKMTMLESDSTKTASQHQTLNISPEMQNISNTKDFSENNNNKFLNAEINLEQPKSDSVSVKYHLSTSEIQKNVLPEQCIETQYDLIIEKESVDQIPSYNSSNNDDPPPLPTTAPPPLDEPVSVPKYLDLLSTTISPTTKLRPAPPPKPVPSAFQTNTHAATAAGVSDHESKWKIFSNAFSEKVIVLVLFWY